MAKECKRCHKIKQFSKFHKNRDNKDDLCLYCKECELERYKTYREDHSMRQKKRINKNKNIVFSHYGNKCALCNCTIREFLTIDHIKGGGAKHRKELKRSGPFFYSWLIKNLFPDGFRILCWNCQYKERYRLTKRNYSYTKQDITNRKYFKKLRKQVINKYGELRDFPLMREKYRVLCANCNWNSYIKTKNNL